MISISSQKASPYIYYLNHSYMLQNLWGFNIACVVLWPLDHFTAAVCFCHTSVKQCSFFLARGQST